MSDWSPSSLSDPSRDSNQDRLGFGKSERLFHSANSASQLPAPGREVNGHSHRMFCSLHLAMSIYGSNHEQRIINVSYCMDSAIAPDRHSASAERVDSSSVLVANLKVSHGVTVSVSYGPGLKQVRARCVLPASESGPLQVSAANWPAMAGGKMCSFWEL